MNTLQEIIKYALWGVGPCDSIIEVDYQTYAELKNQAIATLPAPIMPYLSMPDSLRQEWKKIILKNIAYNCNYNSTQSKLPITVPYVILKGSSAAQYYPYPEYRTMGDIDIITKREDYEVACKMLLDGGYIEDTSKISEEFSRHRGFHKNGIEVEVHAFFALFNDISQAEYLDNIIMQNITDTHFLPDLVNGIVLLAHVAQHLEKGLGLRQIIDWMLFVNNCLSDDNWVEFSSMLQKVKLAELAIIVTRMCEVKLGLKEHKWCSKANESLCIQLWDYVIENGNFGIKRIGEANDSINVFVYARSPKAAFHLLQERGIINWKKTKEQRYLVPFAWLYQLGRYIIKGFGRNHAMAKIPKEYIQARKRRKMLKALGVKQNSKGLTVLRDGRFIIVNKMP